MKNIKSELLPDHKIFELSDGRKFGAHKHSCLFCKHCSDIYWDYTNGIYAINCDKNWNNEESRTEHIKSAFTSGKCKFFDESFETFCSCHSHGKAGGYEKSIL